MGERALRVNVWLHGPPPHLLLSGRGPSSALVDVGWSPGSPFKFRTWRQSCTYGHTLLEALSPLPSFEDLMCHPEGMRNGVKKKEGGGYKE